MSKVICTVCPKSCKLTVSSDFEVSGNQCKRGITYGINEVKNPQRIIASTVEITNRDLKRLSVTLTGEISKDKIFAVMEEIHKVKVQAPIKIHQIIIKNVCFLNVDVISTREVE